MVDWLHLDEFKDTLLPPKAIRYLPSLHIQFIYTVCTGSYKMSTLYFWTVDQSPLGLVWQQKKAKIPNPNFSITTTNPFTCPSPSFTSHLQLPTHPPSQTLLVPYSMSSPCPHPDLIKKLCCCVQKVVLRELGKIIFSATKQDYCPLAMCLHSAASCTYSINELDLQTRNMMM